MGATYLFTSACRDVPGISAAVTGAIADAAGFIVESQQFGDAETGLFFARIALAAAADAPLDHARLRDRLVPVTERFGMRWTLTDAAQRPRTLIAVSRFGHCLNDLLHRWRTGALPIEIIGVVSNHDAMRSLVEWHGLPYHHLPVATETKPRQERALADLIESARAELIVLARYMQVLPDDLVAQVAGRCINIHHSFLPSFKGARPYHQAHRRGVKLIGATAHYVTADLDEGPIIEQDVERVAHDRSAAELVEIGQDIEARVLARAVRWHAERRILLNGDKTVVFR